MRDCVLLTASKFVNKHLSWFLTNGAISTEAASALPKQLNGLIRVLGNQSLELCENLGVPRSLIFAPIYTGYQNYYKSDFTQGEHYDLLNLKPKF